MEWVSLHSHSTFSYGDGFGLPSEHVDRVDFLGMSALALTEHGNVSSHVQLDKAATKVGVKPIFGVELYTAPGLRERRKFHMTVLAMNEVGYRNLNLLVSKTYSEGFYRWPTADGQMLAEHSEGLIVLSGCADSLLSCTLLGGKSLGDKRETASADDVARAVDLASKFKDLFGDRYFLECQQFPSLDRTCTLNKIFASIGSTLDIPLVATADVHYPFPNDNEMQKILHAAHRGSASVAQQEAEWEYNIRLTYPESDDEIMDNLIDTGLTKHQAKKAIESTAAIAERCNVTLPKSERIRYPIADSDWEEW